MSTGGFDFDGMFFNSQEDAEAGIDLFYPEIAYILWIVFMILMPILLSNLLVIIHLQVIFVLPSIPKQPSDEERCGPKKPG